MPSNSQNNRCSVKARLIIALKKYHQENYSLPKVIALKKEVYHQFKEEYLATVSPKAIMALAAPNSKVFYLGVALEILPDCKDGDFKLFTTKSSFIKECSPID